MNVPEFTLLTVDAPWREVAKIYRRVCWLRAGGCSREAETLQLNEFAAAVAAACQSSSASGDLGAQLEAVQIAEETRVTEAVAFAELLAPMIAEHLHAAAIVQGHAPIASLTLPPSTRRPAPTSPPPVTIADFIDGMLEQERSENRLSARHAI